MRHLNVEDDDRVIVIEKQSSGIAFILLGAAIGAGIALLMAPQSGAQTRRGLKRRTRRATRSATRVVGGLADTVVEGIGDVRRHVEEQIDEAVREAIDAKTGQVRRAMDAGKAATREARLDLENSIAQTKAAYKAGAAVAHEPRRPARRPTSRRGSVAAK